MSIFQWSGISSFADCEAAFRELSRLWRKLAFAENFETRTVTVTIPATTEVFVANPFEFGTVAREWIVVDRTGNGSITRGPTAWGAKLSFYNPGASSITATVRIFK